MTINIANLNNMTFNELDSSVPLSAGNGLTIDGGGNYTVSPNSFGNLSSYDNWTGGPALNAPNPGDIVSYNLTVVDPANDIIQYNITTGDGSTTPSVGGIGAIVVAYNNTGVLVETLTGYQPGNQTFNPTGTYLEFSTVDLSQFEAGYNGPPAAALQLGTTGPSQLLGLQCFAAGTRIARAKGETAVEDLRVGDMVALADGGTAPIVWIGHREVDCRRHPQPETVLPVLVAAGAFGESEPRRPLLLSPGHAVFRDGVLIPIRLLMNGSSIRQIECDVIKYYHIELARHSVLLAEGLPAESLLTGAGDRSLFDDEATWREVERIDFAWECLSCAPLVLTGARLEAERRRLAARHEDVIAPVLIGSVFAVAKEAPVAVSSRVHI